MLKIYIPLFCFCRGRALDMFQMNKQPLAVMKKPATMLGVPPAGPAVAAAPPTIIQENTVPKNIIQARDLLYRLIISQLFYDGYQQVAVTLSNMGEFYI
jgi:Cleavage stimulation factor subunit 1, dimerisation domain